MFYSIALKKEQSFDCSFCLLILNFLQDLRKELLGGGLWGFLGGGLFLLGLLLADGRELVHALDEQEHHERHDDEVDDIHDERAVCKRGLADGHAQARKAFEAEAADDGADEVIDERRDEGGESAADDNADRQIHYIAPEGKGLELRNKLFHVYSPYAFYAFLGTKTSVPPM